MTIASFKEQWSAGRLSRGKFEATASRLWQITLTSATGVGVASGLLEVLTHSGLPAIGEGFLGSSGLRCTRLTPMPLEESKIIYNVRADYAQTIDPENPTEQDPTNYNDKITYSTANSTVAIENDIDGKALLNTANDPIVGLTKEHNDVLISVQRNIDDGAIAHIKLYEGMLNLGAWNSLASNTVRCTNINSRKVVDAARTYYDITYQFEYRASGHHIRVLSEGYNQVVSGKKDRINVGSGANRGPSGAFLLTSSGLYSSGTTGYFKSFRIYPQVSYAALGITL